MAVTEHIADVSSKEALAMATINGAEIANLNCGLIEEGRDAALLVLDGDSPNLSGAPTCVARSFDEQAFTTLRA